MYLLNVCVSIEGEAVVMWDGCVPLIRQLDLAILHGVNLPLLKLGSPLSCSVIVHGCLYLSILFVHEIHIEKASLTPDIFPISDLVLFGDLNLDDPILGESVEAADRHEHLVFRKINFWPVVATLLLIVGVGGHGGLHSVPVDVLWYHLWLCILMLISLAQRDGEIKICGEIILRSIF
jgi:hypothetical protein